MSRWKIERDKHFPNEVRVYGPRRSIATFTGPDSHNDAISFSLIKGDRDARRLQHLMRQYWRYRTAMFADLARGVDATANRGLMNTAWGEIVAEMSDE